MTTAEKLEKIADAMLAPLPEGVTVQMCGMSYLRPNDHDEYVGSKVPRNFADNLAVCACGRAILGLAGTKEKAEEIILEWLARPKGTYWEDHASKYLGVSTGIIREIGETFKFMDSYEEMVEELRNNPEQFYN